MTAAIYARVSTDDKGQDVQNQLLELRRYAHAKNWGYCEYVDTESGSHGNRPQFCQMLMDASRSRFNVVLVWALDRLTREGIHKTFRYIEDLRAYGVEFESFTEPHFRTTGPAGELMLAIAAWIAKQERQRISERTKAGMNRAKAAGKHIGRPKAVFDWVAVFELRQAGYSWRKISREMGVDRAMLRERVRLAGKGIGEGTPILVENTDQATRAKADA